MGDWFSMLKPKDLTEYFVYRLERIKITSARCSLEIAEFLRRAVAYSVSYEDGALTFLFSAPMDEYLKIKNKLTALLSSEFDCRVEVALM